MIWIPSLKKNVRGSKKCDLYSMLNDCPFVNLVFETVAQHNCFLLLSPPPQPHPPLGVNNCFLEQTITRIRLSAWGGSNVLFAATYVKKSGESEDPICQQSLCSSGHCSFLLPSLPPPPPSMWDLYRISAEVGWVGGGGGEGGGYHP